MKKINLALIFAVVCFFCLKKESKAQDPAFSQFYANPLYLNPAFSGSAPKGAPRGNLNYRDQWPGIGRTYVTTAVSYDQYVEKIGGGLGVMFVNDRSGDGNLQVNTASLLYAYHLEISKKFKINAGFEATYRRMDLNWDNLTFGDQIDPKYGFIYQTQENVVNNPRYKQFPDFSTGFVGYTENFYFGFAAHHLTQPNQGFISESSLPTKITTHFGGNFPLKRYSNNVTMISPNFLYQKQQDFQQFNYGLYVYRGPFVGGLWARHSIENFDSFILLIGLLQENFKFGYSYDITVSDLKNSNTLGAHELSFTIYLPNKTSSKSFNTVSCPQF